MTTKAQAIANAVATTLRYVPQDSDIFTRLDSEAGLQCEKTNTVIWRSEHQGVQTIVVWLGNEADFDMRNIAEALL